MFIINIFILTTNRLLHGGHSGHSGHSSHSGHLSYLSHSSRIYEYGSYSLGNQHYQFRNNFIFLLYLKKDEELITKDIYGTNYKCILNTTNLNSSEIYYIDNFNITDINNNTTININNNIKCIYLYNIINNILLFIIIYFTSIIICYSCSIKKSQYNLY